MCVGLFLVAASSLVSAQPPLPEFVELGALAEAIEGDASQWSEAVGDTVQWLAERAAENDQAAVGALFALLEVERLRPASPDAPPPDEPKRAALREALLRAEAQLRPTRPDGPPVPPPPPPPPPPRRPTTNTALERLRQPPTPLSMVALIDLAVASGDEKLTHQLVYAVRGERGPEVGRLYEHVFATHCGGDAEAGLADAIAGGGLSYPYAEAAGLLFLLRPDNAGNVQQTLIDCRERWTGERLTQALPWLVAAYDDPWAAPKATEVLAEATGLALPAGPPTLADRARVYRAWRDAAAARPEPAPPLIDPGWDAANPVVAALRTAVEGLALENQRRVVLDQDAGLPARRAAVRRLAFEGTDGDWDTLLRVAETDTDWQLTGHILTVTEAVAPERAGALRERLAARLGTGENASRALVLAVAEAKDRETVMALASLADSVGREGFCLLLEEIARGQVTPPHWQSEGFEAIRNTITAYGAVDLDRARAFYRSLLQEGTESVRRVGIFGVGELRVAEAVPELLPLADPQYENCFRADCVIVALGKISTPEAYDALVAMLDGETDNSRHAWEVMVILCAICGREGRSPQGTWSNGSWATVAEDLPTVGPRFAEALTALADRSTDERLTREARGRAGTCLQAAGRR